MYNAIIVVLECFGIDQILDYFSVFYLRKPYKVRSLPSHILTYLSDSLAELVHMIIVVLTGPMVFTRRGTIIVKLLRIIDRIKEIFYIVESHRTYLVRFVLRLQ